MHEAWDPLNLRMVHIECLHEQGLEGFPLIGLGSTLVSPPASHQKSRQRYADQMDLCQWVEVTLVPVTVLWADVADVRQLRGSDALQMLARLR